MENSNIEQIINNNTPVEEYIYVIEPNNLHYQDGHRKIKIGYTTNLKSRLSSYNTSSPDGITIHGTFRIHQAIDIEKHLHNMYASKATNGNNREWFNLTQLDLINILNYLSIVENADTLRFAKESSDKINNTELQKLLDKDRIKKNDRSKKDKDISKQDEIIKNELHKFLGYLKYNNLLIFERIPTSSIYSMYVSWSKLNNPIITVMTSKTLTAYIQSIISDYGYNYVSEPVKGYRFLKDSIDESIIQNHFEDYEPSIKPGNKYRYFQIQNKERTTI